MSHYAEYAVTDRARLHAFIAEYPFAGIVKNDNGASVPAVVQAPVIRHGEALEFHMARANPAFRCFEAGGSALLLFNGPNTHISAGWYRDKNQALTASTWNYASLHVRGRLERQDEDWLEGHLARLVENFDGRLADGWNFAAVDPTFLRRLTGLICGFRVEIEEMSGIFKCSQDQSPEDRARVMRGLEQRGSGFDAMMAKMMAGEAA